MSMYGTKFKIGDKKIFMPVYLYCTADGQLCCLAVAYSMCDLAMRLEVGVVTYRGWGGHAINYKFLNARKLVRVPKIALNYKFL
jgi:hypothetical protein